MQLLDSGESHKGFCSVDKSSVLMHGKDDLIAVGDEKCVFLFPFHQCYSLLFNLI